MRELLLIEPHSIEIQLMRESNTWPNLSKRSTTNKRLKMALEGVIGMGAISSSSMFSLDRSAQYGCSAGLIT
jgi:hypothetical protein